MTGLTAQALKKKMPFREFALLIARQFGALATLRDEPMDAAIPQEFVPSDYHANRVAQIETRIGELRHMTLEEAKAQVDAMREEVIQTAREEVALHKQTNAYFSKLLMEARDWHPPSPDHEGMKKMMVEQLEMSMEDSGYWDDEVKRVEAQVDPREWLESEISSALSDLEYHRRGQAEEISRVASRNLWLKQLRAALK